MPSESHSTQHDHFVITKTVILLPDPLHCSSWEISELFKAKSILIVTLESVWGHTGHWLLLQYSALQSDIMTTIMIMNTLESSAPLRGASFLLLPRAEEPLGPTANRKNQWWFFRKDGLTDERTLSLRELYTYLISYNYKYFDLSYCCEKRFFLHLKIDY